MTEPTREQLLHLAARARDGVALPAEHDQLAAGITALAVRAVVLQADRNHWRDQFAVERAAFNLAKPDVANGAEEHTAIWAAEQAKAAIERVRKLHRKASHGDTCVYCAHGQRLGYDTTWPCDTIRVLDQAQQPTTTDAPC